MINTEIFCLLCLSDLFMLNIRSYPSIVLVSMWCQKIQSIPNVFIFMDWQWRSWYAKNPQKVQRFCWYLLIHFSLKLRKRANWQTHLSVSFNRVYDRERAEKKQPESYCQILYNVKSFLIMLLDIIILVTYDLLEKTYLGPLSIISEHVRQCMPIYLPPSIHACHIQLLTVYILITINNKALSIGTYPFVCIRWKQPKSSSICWLRPQGMENQTECQIFFRCLGNIHILAGISVLSICI